MASNEQQQAESDISTEPDETATAMSSVSSNRGQHRYNLRRTRASQARSTPARRNTLQTILNNLVGRNPFFGSNHDATDEDLANVDETESSEDDAISFWPGMFRHKPRKPPTPSEADVKMLQESDFYLETQRVLGQKLAKTSRFNVQNNILSVLNNREVRRRSSHNFISLCNHRRAFENINGGIEFLEVWMPIVKRTDLNLLNGPGRESLSQFGTEVMVLGTRTSMAA